MNEVISPPEQAEAQEVEPFDIIYGLCRERGLSLSLENLATLIPSISYENLKDHHIGKQYGIEPLFLVDGSGILIDNRFKELPPEAQKYGLSHELGHLIDSYLRQFCPDLALRLTSVAENLAPETVSRYSAHIEEKTQGSDKPKVAGEKIAELMAQYLTSDGTFLGMVNARLLQERRWAEASGRNSTEGTQNENEITALSQFLSGENPDISELTERFPSFANYYLAYQELDSILRSYETFVPLEGLLTEGFVFDDYLVDYDEMVSGYEPVATPSQPLKVATPEKSLFVQLFDFSAIFGGKSE